MVLIILAILFYSAVAGAAIWLIELIVALVRVAIGKDKVGYSTPWPLRKIK